MDRDGMEMNVKVGGQWVSLKAYRRIRAFENSVAIIGTTLILLAMFGLAFLSL